jgi:DNA (cytosine-5)-methyltransferase 1
MIRKPYMSTPVSVKEAAFILGVSAQRVRYLCRTGMIQSQKVGRAWIVDKDILTEYGLKHANILAKNHQEKTTKDTDSPIALSFFSGAMGLDLGIERAGFEIKLACEYDKYSRQTIAMNKPNIGLIEDINDYEAADVLQHAGLTSADEIDLVIGGPPCQAFSTAGKRAGFKDDRGNVFLKYIELALELKPKYIVIENVRGLLSMPMSHRPHNQRGEGFPDLAEDELRGGALNFVVNILEKSNYSYSFELYNSAFFGTPQTRERVIIICSRDGNKPPHLVPTHTPEGTKGFSKWRTFKNAVGRLKKHDHINFPEKRIRYYKMLKAGENWKALSEDLQKEALGNSYYAGGGKTGFLRRLAWDKPSPTLVTHPAMPATDLCHPIENRPLSIQEYKRIQEFPDKWKLAGPLTEQYKQVGNAVPGSLGYAVGKLLIDLLNSRRIVKHDGFKYSRYKNTDELSWKVEFDKELEKANKARSQIELSF